MRNEETVKYLNIMIESLEKKTSLLEQLHKKTVLQSECIAGKDSDDANWEQFDVLIVEKDSLMRESMSLIRDLIMYSTELNSKWRPIKKTIRMRSINYRRSLEHLQIQALK